MTSQTNPSVATYRFKLSCEITEMIHAEAETRVHFISLLYKVEIEGVLDESLKWRFGTPKSGQWHWHRNWPDNMYGPQSVYKSIRISTD